MNTRIDNLASAPDPLLSYQISVGILVVLVVLCCMGCLWIYHHHKTKTAEKERLIAQLGQQLEQQKKRHAKQVQQITRGHAENATISVRQLSSFLTHVHKLQSQYPTPAKEWSNYLSFKQDVQMPFGGLIAKLEHEFALSEKEIMFCIYSILYKDMTATEIASYLFYSMSGIRTFKQRTARKLGTMAASLYDTLLCMAIDMENKGDEVTEAVTEMA